MKIPRPTLPRISGLVASLFFFFFFFNVYLFILRERQRDREREQGRGSERRRERIPSLDSGLSLTNHEIMT